MEMDERFVSARQALTLNDAENLGIPESVFDLLVEDFKMFRTVRSKSMYNAATFAFLEHLCRPLTNLQDFSQTIKSFSLQLQKKLSVARSQFNQGKSPFEHLGNMVSKREIKKIAILNFTIVNYSIKNGKLESEVISTFKQHKSLLVPVLSLEHKQILLYSELMSFVDGFNSETGRVSIHDIPSDLLSSIEKQFYFNHLNKHNKRPSNLYYNESTGDPTTPHPPEDTPCTFAFPQSIRHLAENQPVLDELHPFALENEIYSIRYGCAIQDSCLSTDICSLL